MEYGGIERRTTKKDKKRKRLARGYKRGGKFRTHEIKETNNKEETTTKKHKKKNKKRKQ